VAPSTHARTICHLEHLRHAFPQPPGLPFADLLPEDTAALLGPSTEPTYTPARTRALFLSQARDADGSCQQAVARLQAWQAATGQPVCSSSTGAYCKARQRLRPDAIRTLAEPCGRTLTRRAGATTWLWKGRPVRLVDGSTVTTADTPANQKAYPQPDGQKPGLGFPMLRLVVLFCLATGAVLKAAYSPYQGKGTGEISLLRQVWDVLEPGDVPLGDRIYCSYFEIALLQQRGVDVVFHKHQSRRTDFRTGTRLGRSDHRIARTKPARPAWMDEAAYQSLAGRLAVREVRVRVDRAGFRVRQFEIITTLLDPAAVSAADRGAVYRQRWQAERDVRALKDTLGLGRLRCKTPAMVQAELWVYVLAYNLIRGSVAQAAHRCGGVPWRLSFKGAVQAVAAFGWALSLGDAATRSERLEGLWRAIGSNTIPDRPDRVEPRAIKKRKSKYPVLTEPRTQARQRLYKANPGIGK
jgi:hypothetical protein